MRACAESLSHVWLFVTPWTVSPPGSSVHGILQASIVGWLAIPFSRRSSWPRNRPRSPALQADSLPSEPPGKSTKNLQFKKMMLSQWRKYLEKVKASLVAQLVKKLPAMWETWVESLGWEDPLEKGMATHSSVLAWKIPMDRGAWRATVHGVAKSWTRLSNFTHSLTHSCDLGQISSLGFLTFNLFIYEMATITLTLVVLLHSTWHM